MLWLGRVRLGDGGAECAELAEPRRELRGRYVRVEGSARSYVTENHVLRLFNAESDWTTVREKFSSCRPDGTRIPDNSAAQDLVRAAVVAVRWPTRGEVQKAFGDAPEVTASKGQVRQGGALGPDQAIRVAADPAEMRALLLHRLDLECRGWNHLRDCMLPTPPRLVFPPEKGRFDWVDRCKAELHDLGLALDGLGDDDRKFLAKRFVAAASRQKADRVRRRREVARLRCR